MYNLIFYMGNLTFQNHFPYSKKMSNRFLPWHHKGTWKVSRSCTGYVHLMSSHRVMLHDDGHHHHKVRRCSVWCGVMELCTTILPSTPHPHPVPLGEIKMPGGRDGIRTNWLTEWRCGTYDNSNMNHLKSIAHFVQLKHYFAVIFYKTPIATSFLTSQGTKIHNFQSREPLIWNYFKYKYIHSLIIRKLPFYYYELHLFNVTKL